LRLFQNASVGVVRQAHQQLVEAPKYQQLLKSVVSTSAAMLPRSTIVINGFETAFI
jgi:hypothetical protein